MEGVSIRKAAEEDCESIFQLICELAEYERSPNEVITSPATLVNDGFRENPLFEAIVACNNNEVVGFALFFTTYSTWKGKCLYLEDFVVRENLRGKGIGKKLFDNVLSIAKERSVKRFAWQVLEWNKDAIAFYEQYDVDFDEEWVNCRMHF